MFAAAGYRYLQGGRRLSTHLQKKRSGRTFWGQLQTMMATLGPSTYQKGQFRDKYLYVGAGMVTLTFKSSPITLVFLLWYIQFVFLLWQVIVPILIFCVIIPLCFLTGGPKMTHTPARWQWVQVGAVNWGIKCGEAVPSVYRLAELGTRQLFSFSRQRQRNNPKELQWQEKKQSMSGLQCINVIAIRNIDRL